MLIIALLAILLLAVVAAVFVRLVAGNIDFSGRQAAVLSAEHLARSGLDYAAHQLGCGDWLDRPRPFALVRNLGRGRIDIRVSDFNSRMLKVQSTGFDETGVRRKLCMFVGRPDVMTDHVLCVLNFDITNGRYRTGSIVRIGSGDTGVSSISEELHIVPEDGIVKSEAPHDRYYAGLVPGTTCVIDDSGAELDIEGLQPEGPGHYSVDLASGTFVFHRSDAGRRICLFYDYFRRVPLAPNPYAVVLPNAPVKPNSERVWDANGVHFRRSYVFPSVQANYFVDYQRGVVRVSEFDSGRAIRVAYSLLGSRHTGPIHVNGDLEWCNRNACFLFERRGDKVSASGRFRYAPGATVSIWTENTHIQDARFVKEAASVYRQGQALLEPPLFNLDWLRRQADPGRGGSGWYFDNLGDVEKLAVGESVSHAQYESALFDAWQSRQGMHWSAGEFDPPGVVIDLAELPPGEPDNGLIFAEGNLRVRGRIPEGRRLTLVSANNIYIDGNIWRKDDRSALALIAEKNICINVSGTAANRMAEVGTEFYVNALLCARRGTLAVIPGSARHRRAIIFGAVCINTAYNDREWGKAFSSTDFVFDPSFRSCRTRPPYLATVLQIGGGER